MTREMTRAKVAASFRADLDNLTAGLVARSVERIPEYAALVKSGKHQKFLDNVRQHLEVYCDLLDGGAMAPQTTAFAYQAARERAEQGMSLASILQSYQLVTLGIWNWASEHPELSFDDAATRDFWPVWLDYVDAATRASADAYVVTSRERVHADADARRTFLETLLAGRLTELEWARWLTHFGYDAESTKFAVVVLRWWAEEEFRVLDSATRTSRAAAERLRAASGAAPIEAVRDHEVVLLVPSTGMSRRRIQEELARALAARPSPDLPASGAVSAFVSGPAAVVEAHGQTLRAVRVTKATGTVEVVEDIGLFDHALAVFRDDVRGACAPKLAAFVREAAADPRDVWLPTIRAWADCNMNSAEAAQLLHVHRNTVYYRISQMSQLLGIDLSTVNGLLDVLVAVRLADELSHP